MMQRLGALALLCLSLMAFIGYVMAQEMTPPQALIGDGNIRLGRAESDPALREGFLMTGDMAIRPEWMQTALERDPSTQGTIANPIDYWTDGVIYYAFAPNVEQWMRDNTRTALDLWESQTPVRFYEWSGEPNYIYVQSCDGNWSYVGMIGGAQDLCMYNWEIIGVIAHEFAHAMGVWHEQQRADRDNYVRIEWENIQEGTEGNFDILPAPYGYPYGDYDFESVMHYGPYAFSKNGQPTITVLPPYEAYQNIIGNRLEVSAGDFATVAYMYDNSSTVNNDSPSTAKLISPPLPYINFNRVTTATRTTDEPATTCGPYTQSVWYLLQPTANQNLRLLTSDSNYDTLAAVFRYNAANNRWSQVACNNDTVRPQAVLDFDVSAGLSYYIVIGKAGNTPATNALLQLELHERNRPPRPTLISPANNSFINTTTPTITYADVPYAVDYQLEYGTDSTFTTIIWQELFLTSPVFTVPAPLANGMYYVRFRGLNTLGQAGDWRVSRFTVDTIKTGTPSVVNPLTGTTHTSAGLLFQWTRPTGTASYRLTIQQTGAANALVIPLGNVTSYRLPALLQAGEWSWQIRALDVAGNVSNPSTAQTFTVLDANNANPTLDFIVADSLAWNPLTWAIGYEVQLDIENTFNSGNLQTFAVSGSTPSLDISTLPEGTRWYWRVRGERPDGTFGGWSAAQRVGVR